MSDLTQFTSQFENLVLKKEFSGVRLPKLEIDKALRTKLKLNAEDSNEKVLLALCREGFASKKLQDKISKERYAEYGERVKYEFSVISKLKFVDYFLIIWDVVRFCNENKIAVGLGRGSAAGSLIFYLIGVTGVDPIKHNLLFERFISPSRSKFEEIDGDIYLSGSIPDVDLDIAYLDRYKVVEYLDKKYPNRTAKILNLSTLTGKTLIKEAGKFVYEKSEEEMKIVSNMVPVVFGVVTDIAEVYEENAPFKKWCDENPRAYKIALKLRDLIKHKSVHASGLALSYDSIVDACPVELSKDGELVCSFNMDDMGEMMVKIDLLGLKTLSVIDGVCKDAGIKMEDINFEDPDIYTFIRNTDHFYGLFQIEAATAYNTTKRLQPENINDLSAIMALARPGGIQSIGRYIEAKNSGVCEKIDPEFDPILKVSWGQIVYQEQLMQICNTLGFSLEDGYKIIKIVGKKQIDQVQEWKQKIYDTAEKNGKAKKLADIAWTSLEASASYSFNFSHSLCYSGLCAITAYLKSKYPLFFFTHCLNIAKDEAKSGELIARIFAEMKVWGIPMLAPDLSIGNDDFILDNGSIRYGLSAIKGIAGQTLEKIRKFKPDNSNKFALFESAKNSNLNITTLSSLIHAGSLPNFGQPRSKVVLEAKLWNCLTVKEKSESIENGYKFSFDLIEMMKDRAAAAQLSEKPIKIRRIETIRKAFAPFQALYAQNIQYEDLTNWFYEKEILGFAYSKTLKQIFEEENSNLIDSVEINALENRSNAHFIGIVDEVKHSKGKNGKMYTKLYISDELGQFMAFIFEPDRTRLMHEEGKILPKEGQIYSFKGWKNRDYICINDYSSQSNEIYLKVADFNKVNKGNKKQNE